MAPDAVLGLSRQVRDGLHLAAWIEATVNPSLLPVVPAIPPGSDAKTLRAVLDVSKYRDLLLTALFPEDDDLG